MADGPRYDGAGYNDPPRDSLFDKISEKDNRCRLCGGVTSNNTEGRDAHLNKWGCHVQ